jgi:ribonuclease R
MGYTEDKILKLMQDSTGRPMSFKDLVRSFAVKREEWDAFKGRLDGMVKDGSLVKISGARYGLPSKMNLLTGEVQCHPDGFGFVRPEGAKPGREEDVFISPKGLKGAMHGDTVVIRLEGFRGGRGSGKRQGRIIRVLKRAHKTVVGRFEKAKGFAVVIPSDERLLEEIIIAAADTGGAEDGTIVEAEITRWPTPNAGPAGRVLEVLGDPKDPDVEANVILKKYGLAHRFPPAVMHEAKGAPACVAAHDAEGRGDLRGRNVFTIDGETARDFDDAVSIERTERGYRLLVSIADVSHYVREGTALDREAYSRSTSVYFPDRCVPMLPEALSNGICSLNPGVDRLTLTAEMDFNARGAMVRKRFYASVIRSVERLTYTNVKRLLAGGDASLDERYSGVLGDLRLMEELARKLMERRAEAGSIDFDLPEPQIIIDIEGNIEDIVRSERNIAHRIVEEFMLAANKSVAEEFSSRSFPFIYRVHAGPDADGVEDFAEFLKGLGLAFKAGGGPKSFQKILKLAEGRPEERLINHVMLRSMKQAVYSAENIGHFGLAFKDYTHFTSPIRRYPDLVVHRLIKSFLAGSYTDKAREAESLKLPPIASHTSERERKAMEAEREVVDLKKAQFMKDKVGSTYDGFISGVTSFGLFVELKEYFVEGLVHVSSLGDDYYIYDELRHTLMGENTKRAFRLGDALKVKVNAVDIERRRIDLTLAGDGAGERKKTGGRAPRRGKPA